MENTGKSSSMFYHSLNGECHYRCVSDILVYHKECKHKIVLMAVVILPHLCYQGNAILKGLILHPGDICGGMLLVRTEFSF